MKTLILTFAVFLATGTAAYAAEPDAVAKAAAACCDAVAACCAEAMDCCD